MHLIYRIALPWSVLPFLLQGCLPLAVTAAGSATVVATDPRSAGAQVDDEIIEDKVLVMIHQRFKGPFHVNVTSYDGIVLLTGEVPADGAKSEVGDMVSALPKVRSVQNELVIAAPTEIGSRSNDLLITSKVKIRFVEANKFQITHVKVVTERGVVYLLGLVRHAEGNAAADIASTTSGVQRVVKVFEYVAG